MTDEIDRASELEQLMRDDALQAHERRAGLKGKTMADSAEWCGCGEPIPEARRRAIPGCQQCVDCRSRAERLGKA